jgi:mRNA interferase HicA
MKYTEFHRWLRKHRDESERDWEWTGESSGSHYIYKDKNGVRYPIPYHGAKEFPEGLRKRILKDMGF